MAVEKRQGERNAWYTSELVVVQEHRAEVLRVLDRWKVGIEPTKGNEHLYESRDLGLALIPLVDVRKAADRAVKGLRAEAAKDAAVAARIDPAVEARHAAQEPGLDQLLWALRTTFAATYDGWTPTLGKNRLGGDVEGGNGQISHTSTLDPPKKSAWRPREATRPTLPGVGVRVGVLDTSLYPHPWLAGGVVGPGEDFLEAEGEYPAEAGHGTFVTGLVLQRAPGCVIEFRKVLSDDEGTATSWDLAKKIVEVGRSGVDVLNLSLGCYTEDGQPPLLLATAIDRLDPDIVVVAAAGNHGDAVGLSAEERRKPAWPAALDDVVAVGSASADGVPSSFTPRDVPWIDVLAPGEQVRSTYLRGRVDRLEAAPRRRRKDVVMFDGYAEWGGSSFAAALVSGAIAARTVPGQRSAREAWHSLADEAVRTHEDRRTKARKRDRRPVVDERFLPLLDGR